MLGHDSTGWGSDPELIGKAIDRYLANSTWAHDSIWFLTSARDNWLHTISSEELLSIVAGESTDDG